MARSNDSSSASVSTNMSALSTCARMMASSPRASARRMRRSAAALSLRGKMDSGKSFVNTLLLGLVLRLERRNDIRISQRRRVPQRPSLGDIAQQSPHDLPGARFWQVRREQHVIRARDRPDLLGDELTKL